MEKKHILMLLGISFLLCNCVAFLDEGRYSFHYLTQGGDWIALVVYTALFMVVPITLFTSAKKKIKTRFYRSLIGFSPIVLLIVQLLV